MGEAIVRVYRAIVDEEQRKVLWEARWTYEMLEAKRRELGTLIFNCEFQNDPSGLEGWLFKSEWLRFYDELPPLKELHVYQAWDLAISEAPDADYTVCCTFARHVPTGRVYVLEWYRDRIDFPTQVRKVRELYEAAARRYGRPRAVYIEENVYQKALVQQVRALGGVPAIGVKTTKNKEERMAAFTPWFENGTILLPSDAPGVDDFIAEYLQFPDAAHDDMLDALELGVTKVVSKARYRSVVF
jgi:predicted phage terminase large subunit-like protein